MGSRIVCRLLVAAVSAVTLAAALPATAAPAGAGAKPVLAGFQPAVPGGFASWAALYAYQDRLNAAATGVLAAGGAGKASIVADPVSRQLQVYWYGQVPDAVRSATGKLDVPVRFGSARYPLSELVAEARRLTADPRLASVAPAPDGSGLRMTLVQRELAAGQADLVATARVPVSVSVGPRPTTTAGRQADTAPFWGGSRYIHGTSLCSSGFSLRVGDRPTNNYAITAGHCGALFDPFTVPGQSSPTGQMFGAAACRDNLLLGYFSQVTPRIYTGTFDSLSSAQVVGAAPDFVGNMVQTGGASSGEHFGIQVQSVDTFGDFGVSGCASVGPLTLASYPTSSCASAPGDSGGPVYTYSGPDVVGRGTITGGFQGTASCPGGFPNGSSSVFYAPLLRPAGDPQNGSFQTYSGVSILT
ncbi:MAG: hypothetical protein V7637_114 [Mycobacteriales bacterium]